MILKISVSPVKRAVILLINIEIYNDFIESMNTSKLMKEAKEISNRIQEFGTKKVDVSCSMALVEWRRGNEGE